MAESDVAKHLFLFDGMALIYRAHFALIRSPRFTSGGVCTSAVFGLANTLLDIFNRQQPTHVAAVFDTREPTQRHNEFPEYKAQREKIPDDTRAPVGHADVDKEILIARDDGQWAAPGETGALGTPPRG